MLGATGLILEAKAGPELAIGLDARFQSFAFPGKLSSDEVCINPHHLEASLIGYIRGYFKYNVLANIFYGEKLNTFFEHEIWQRCYIRANGLTVYNLIYFK